MYECNRKYLYQTVKKDLGGGGVANVFTFPKIGILDNNF